VNAQLKANCRTFRGAKIRPKDAPSPLATAAHPQVEHYSAIGYDLAVEGRKRKKNWARRWFEAHRPGKFYP
jgi:hypothetical protein